MNAETQHFDRSELSETISPVSLAYSMRSANLNFFGPIALVCGLGILAHFIQSLLMN